MSWLSRQKEIKKRAYEIWEGWRDPEPGSVDTRVNSRQSAMTFLRIVISLYFFV
jgi:hypothetical protein